MFVVVIFGIIFGGFIVLLFIVNVFFDFILVMNDEFWWGLFMVVGSWIGGGVN